MTSTSQAQAREAERAADIVHLRPAGGDSPSPTKQRSPSIVIASAASADLAPAPITPDWIIEGAPEARNALVARSEDRTASILVWECKPGRFNWSYAEDEAVSIISGEVFITTPDGLERRLGPGDVAFFTAGSSCTWRVTECVRKVAFLRKDMPLLFGFALRAWHKLLRITGVRGQMPF